MANLVIDIGNTLTKIAAFDNDELLYTEHFITVTTDILNEILRRHPVNKAIISSVKKDSEEWQALLNDKTQLIYFNARMITGINNHYLTPNTLGLDRLAAVIGANHLYPGKNSLVV